MNLRNIALALVLSSTLGACKKSPFSSAKEDATQIAKDAACDVGNDWWIVLMTGHSLGGKYKGAVEIAMGALLSLGNGALQRSSVCQAQTTHFSPDDVAQVTKSEFDRAFADQQIAKFRASLQAVGEYVGTENGDSPQYLNKQIAQTAREALEFDTRGLNYFGNWVGAVALELAFMQEKVLASQADPKAAPATVACNAQAIVDVINGVANTTACDPNAVVSDDMISAQSAVQTSGSAAVGLLNGIDAKIEAMKQEADAAAVKFFEPEVHDVRVAYTVEPDTNFKKCRNPVPFTAAEAAYIASYSDPKAVPETLKRRKKLIDAGEICEDVGLDSDATIAHINQKVNDMIKDLANAMRTELIETQSQAKGLVRTKDAIVKRFQTIAASAHPTQSAAPSPGN